MIQSKPTTTAVLLCLVSLAGASCSPGATQANPPPPPPPSTAASCYDGTFHSECPAGETCSSLISNHQVTPACLPACNFGPGKQGCAAGQVCYPAVNSPDEGSCRPGCKQASDCRSGLACDGSSGQCKCSASSDCSVAFGFPLACRADGFCAAGCTADQDCGCGGTCTAGSCQPGCHTNADCCGGGACEAGQCARAPSSAGYSRCASSDECPAGMFCDNSFPRGQCLPVPDLTRTCATGACPGGSTCVSRPTTDGKFALVCRETCTPGASGACGADAVCIHIPNDPASAACFPGCFSNSECGAGRTCDLASHTCQCQLDSACSSWGPGATCNVTTGECSAPKCVPRCDGTTCGSDGCGGGCSCASGSQCNSSGQCVRPPAACQVSPAGTCNDPASVFCGTGCCPSSTPYACPAAGKCYASATEASAACGGSTCYVCSASTVGGGSCQPTSGGSCADPSANVCGSHGCCPSGSPFACPSTGRCYPTQSEAITACGSTGCYACNPPAAGGTCHMETSCVSAVKDFPTGLGHCAGEMTGHLTNHCGVTVSCKVCPTPTPSGGCGGFTIGDGQTVGGEGGGMWWCNEGTQLTYWCDLPSDSNSCFP